MPLRDHLNKLHYYQAIVEARSILKASRVVGITQPQLSRVVKSLEEILETQLLVRTPSGVETTREGDLLYKAALEILSDVAEVEKKILFGKAPLSGKINVGTYDSIARYFFPIFLKYLASTFPDVDLILQTHRSSDVVDKVNDGSLDIGVIVGTKNLSQPGVIAQKIYDDSFGFYHHPGIAKGFMDTLIYFPEAVGNDPKNQNRFIKKYGFQQATLSDNLETVKALAEESVGIAMLPHRVARESVLQGKLTPLKRIGPTKSLYPHSIYLCRGRKQKPSTRDAKIDSLVSEISRFLISWSKN